MIGRSHVWMLRHIVVLWSLILSMFLNRCSMSILLFLLQVWVMHCMECWYLVMVLHGLSRDAVRKKGS
ncbi:hypothetical protein BCR41DRAFT_356176 [Lobosporangium transversale]|uniref:Uncharacterized protein n=1 Tax=Lobosporangium transversale TaxID=64571 RepID=A0A1Y2GND8_9FUNG|nr:hypothetical protein BCR41DRAFT_356176 [Lobosporangium transversale]ORZ12494.1 hypothetical protein BCR41DRAFT_356176 [Lobosporangium transversale]|eukprot:XP_021880113.1 hypothetical protein BCR41DRAFT_356176 [Lobosporangium transversale]